MRSSTSSSDVQPARVTPIPGAEPAVAAPVEPGTGASYQRPLPRLRFGVVGATALAVFAIGLGAWEAYWRARGSVPAIRNSAGLWAEQRRRIAESDGRVTVAIGSSRMLSDLQLPVWERLSGERPIQLSLEGTSPMAALEDLAADSTFRGRLLVGVTPGLFFNGFAYRGEVIAEWRDETPSERWGQWLSQHLLEPWLAYLDPDFALVPVLQRMPWPQREAKPFRRPVPKLFLGDGDRNSRLWVRVERDTAYRDLARSMWTRTFRPLPAPGSEDDRRRRDEIDREIGRAVAAVQKLRARGAEVIFVRHPSGGGFLENENLHYPRAETWDVLLARTGARGIHFEDYPELSAFDPPEWSHLTGADADRYTEALFRIVGP